MSRLTFGYIGEQLYEILLEMEENPEPEQSLSENQEGKSW